MTDKSEDRLELEAKHASLGAAKQIISQLDLYLKDKDSAMWFLVFEGVITYLLAHLCLGILQNKDADEKKLSLLVNGIGENAKFVALQSLEMHGKLN